MIKVPETGLFYFQQYAFDKNLNRFAFIVLPFLNLTMEKFVNYFRNKFIFTTFLFFVYMLFLDDVDIFTIINQKRKYYRLVEAKDEVTVKLSTIRHQLNQLKYTSELESFAREEKLFKKENEDIFIISYE